MGLTIVRIAHACPIAIQIIQGLLNIPGHVRPISAQGQQNLCQMLYGVGVVFEMIQEHMLPEGMLVMGHKGVKGCRDIASGMVEINDLDARRPRYRRNMIP